jgi:phosphatidylglycerophosphate synthase
MTFSEFQAKSFPEKSVFRRPQFDFVTNLVKWFALRLAYLFFRMGITANLLDVLGILLALAAFSLLYTAVNGYRLLPLLGIGILYFHVLIDFIDGAIAKAHGTCSKIGHLLDSLGCDIDRFVLIVLFGLYTGNPYFVVANTIAASVLILFAPQTRAELPDSGLPGRLRNVYVNKYSFLSVRFMLTLLPLFLGIVIVSGWNLRALSYGLSLAYGIAAAGWLLLCIPHYETKAASLPKKEMRYGS